MAMTLRLTDSEQGELDHLARAYPVLLDQLSEFLVMDAELRHDSRLVLDLSAAVPPPAVVARRPIALWFTAAAADEPAASTILSMDVGGKFAGTLSGSMNMMGNFAGGVAPVVIGYVLKQTGNDFTITVWSGKSQPRDFL